MKLYWQIWLFGLQRYFAYPVELAVSILGKVVSIGFLVIFWSIVADSSEQELDIKTLASYFLIADGLATIINSYDTMIGRFVRRRVKDGSVATFMLLPINLLPYSYFNAQGGNAVNIILSIISILVGIIIFPPTHILGIFLFLISLTLAFLIGITFNLLEANMSFLFTEVHGIKNALRHLSRIFSGLVIPLSLFPEGLKQVAEFTPFPYMIFYPIQMLNSTELSNDLIKPFLISLYWVIFGLGSMLILWKYVLRKYEAVGL